MGENALRGSILFVGGFSVPGTVIILGGPRITKSRSAKTPVMRIAMTNNLGFFIDLSNMEVVEPDIDAKELMLECTQDEVSSEHHTPPFVEKDIQNSQRDISLLPESTQEECSSSNHTPPLSSAKVPTVQTLQGYSPPPAPTQEDTSVSDSARSAEVTRSNRTSGSSTSSGSNSSREASSKEAGRAVQVLPTSSTRVVINPESTTAAADDNCARSASPKTPPRLATEAETVLDVQKVSSSKRLEGEDIMPNGSCQPPPLIRKGRKSEMNTEVVEGRQNRTSPAESNEIAVKSESAQPNPPSPVKTARGSPRSPQVPLAFAIMAGEVSVEMPEHDQYGLDAVVEDDSDSDSDS